MSQELNLIRTQQQRDSQAVGSLMRFHRMVLQVGDLHSRVDCRALLVCQPPPLFRPLLTLNVMKSRKISFSDRPRLRSLPPAQRMPTELSIPLTEPALLPMMRRAPRASARTLGTGTIGMGQGTSEMARAIETTDQKVYDYDVTIMSAGVPLRRRKRRSMTLSERRAGMVTVTKVETKTLVER